MRNDNQRRNRNGRMAPIRWLGPSHSLLMKTVANQRRKHGGGGGWGVQIGGWVSWRCWVASGHDLSPLPVGHLADVSANKTHGALPFAHVAARGHDKIFLMLLQARLNPIALESLSPNGDLTWPNPKNSNWLLPCLTAAAPLLRVGKQNYIDNFRHWYGHQWVND